MGNTFSIEFYKKGLENKKLFLIKEKGKMRDLRKSIARMEREIEFREFQIEEAIKQGKEKFDSERFLIKKRKD